MPGGWHARPARLKPAVSCCGTTGAGGRGAGRIRWARDTCAQCRLAGEDLRASDRLSRTRLSAGTGGTRGDGGTGTRRNGGQPDRSLPVHADGRVEENYLNAWLGRLF